MISTPQGTEGKKILLDKFAKRILRVLFVVSEVGATLTEIECEEYKVDAGSKYKDSGRMLSRDKRKIKVESMKW